MRVSATEAKNRLGYYLGQASGSLRTEACALIGAVGSVISGI